MKTMMAIVAGLVLASPAFANPARSVGSCSDGSVWELVAQRDGGRVEVEFEVESFRPGERWVVFMRQNGGTPARAVRTSRGSDGYWWVERYFPNAPGDDLFEGFARNTVTGEVCRAQVVWST